MEIRYEPTLFIISGPSGVGKSSICREVLKETENLEFSISYTTRGARDDEVDGVDYHFISDEEFNALMGKNEFIEYANVHGNYYGTRRSEIDKKLKRGDDVLLDIDVQGAKQVKNSFNGGVFIFVIPPSTDELRRRLLKREGEIDLNFEMRLKVAMSELEHIDDYDYVIVNDDLKDAVDRVGNVISAERTRRRRLKIEFN